MGDPVRPGPITQRLVGQGPCVLPGVRYKAGRRAEGRPYGEAGTGGVDPRPYGGYKRCGERADVGSESSAAGGG